MMVEQELVFDGETRRYRVMEILPSSFKIGVSCITAIMLVQLWDLYEYTAVGMKKEWYIALYTNSENAGQELPRGILGQLS